MFTQVVSFIQVNNFGIKFTFDAEILFTPLVDFAGGTLGYVFPQRTSQNWFVVGLRTPFLFEAWQMDCLGKSVEPLESNTCVNKLSAFPKHSYLAG